MKKKLTGSIDVTNMIPKFVDCRSKDLSRRELYIVEGDSALGSVKMARDAEFQAVIPVRGKILNCLKADYNKIFKNEIITDIIKLLGCGVEVTTKANKDISSFNLDGMRWNKIVICTDADVDGFQIRTLILTMLYRLTPTLIDKGCVYIAESPLFEITTKKRTYFAYTEKEKTEILATLENEKYTLQRSKGLGENEADMMALTTMNPETRRLIQVTAAGIEETAAMFDMLLGMTSRDEKISLLNLAAIIWNWQISHKSEDKNGTKETNRKTKKIRYQTLILPVPALWKKRRSLTRWKKLYAVCHERYHFPCAAGN